MSNIYSIKNNLIFIHIPKCGGTSFREFNDLQEDERIHNPHLTYRQLSSFFHKHGMGDFFQNANIHTRVRNPMTRMKSLYRFIKLQPTNAYYRAVIALNFDDFIKLISKHRNRVYGPAFEYLRDGKEIPKRIKIERLEDIERQREPRVNYTSGYVSHTEYTEKLIKEWFYKDYELWYS